MMNDSDVFGQPDCFFASQTDVNGSEQLSVAGTNTSACDLDSLINNINMYSASSEFDALNEPLYIGLMVTLYVIVIVIGALGNMLVVVTILKTKPMWNATNIFIANLALADIFVCVFDLPLNAYYQITKVWVFGQALCHVIPSVFAFVVYTSSLTLTMIAIDRYMLIVYPLKNRMSISVAIILVGVIALVAMAVASPIAIYASYITYDDDMLDVHYRVCSESWPTMLHRRLYTLLTLAFQFFVPLIIIAILYTLIFRRVQSRMNKMAALRGKGQSNRKTKTTKMLVAVVTVFAVTWTPFQLYSIITDFAEDLIKGRYFRLTDALLRVFAMSSSCINPILYGWMNDNYKKAFYSIIRRPTATPRGIRAEESEVTKGRCVANVSPIKILYQKLNKNGQVTTVIPEGEQTVGELAAGTDLTVVTPEVIRASGPGANGCSVHLPLLERKTTVFLE